jgi:hypothetical protein
MTPITIFTKNTNGIINIKPIVADGSGLIYQIQLPIIIISITIIIDIVLRFFFFENSLHPTFLLFYFLYIIHFVYMIYFINKFHNDKL